MVRIIIDFLGGYTEPNAGRFHYDVGKTWKICNDSSFISRYYHNLELDGGGYYPSGGGALYFTIPDTYEGRQMSGGNTTFRITFELNGDTIPANAFSGLTDIAYVSLYDYIDTLMVTTVGDYAFSGCTNLTKLYIHTNLQTIGDYAFSGCSSLNYINVRGTGDDPSITPTTFKDVGLLGTIKYVDKTEVNSSWLSTSPYYLGTYFWGGVNSEGNDVGDVIRKITITYDIQEYKYEIGIPLFQIDYTVDDFEDIIYNGSSIKNNIYYQYYNFSELGLISVDYILKDGVIKQSMFALPSALGEGGIVTAKLQNVVSLEKRVFQVSQISEIYVNTVVPPIIDKFTFDLVTQGGTLYYPEGADYSSWLSANSCYLGYYGWNGVEISNEPIEPDEPEVTTPYVTGTTTVLYFNYDGTPKTTKEFDVYWYGDYYDRNIANDSSHFGVSGKKIETTDDYVKYHYTVNCPQNTTSEVITGSCYFNIKLDASTYGESFVVDFIQDAKPNTNYSPEIEIEETTVEVSASASSSYVDVTYIDMESYNPPEIMWGSKWFTLTTTTINNTETIRYFYTIAENTNAEQRSARVKFSGTGLDGENYEIYLDIIQDKKQQQTMADIRLNSFDIENGTLYFESSGDTKTVECIVDGYTQPYSFNVNINASNNDVVLNKSELDYDNGKGYLIWVFEFQSKQNTNTNPSTGHITIDYEDGTGTYSTNLPFYIRYENEGIIHPYVSQITFKSDGSPENSGYDRFSVGYNGLGTVGDVTVDADWISVQEDGVESGGYYEEVYTYLVEVQPNTGQYREGHITLTMVDTIGSTKTATILIKQKEGAVVPDEPEPDYPEGSDEETYSPIWKDVYYDFTYDSSYSIYTEVSRYINNNIGTIVEEQLLYSGKVYLPPYSESVKVMINKICQNYFENSYLPTDGSVGLIHNYKKFILKGEYGQVLHTYYFVNDWSYKELEVGIKTNPILPYIGDGQMLFFSAFADSRKQTIKWGMRYYNGENDYDNTQYLTNGFETVIVAQSRQKGVNQFYFGNKVYSMIPKCRCQYVLYYTNPYGGFDWFPLLGKVNKKDRITQYTYTNNYNNTTTDFGKYRYLTEITTHYTLNTGFLTEGQSLRMWELLESNCVYLHCLEENKIYPVIITSTEVDYKKKERGRKMLSYTIDVDYSQTRERI